MAKYLVTVAKVIYGDVFVEAKNKAEAEALAREEYDYDNISWDDNESLEITNVERRT